MKWSSKSNPGSSFAKWLLMLGSDQKVDRYLEFYIKFDSSSGRNINAADFAHSAIDFNTMAQTSAMCSFRRFSVRNILLADNREG